MNKLEEILNTPYDNDIGYFIELDLKDLDNIKEKTKNFPFAPENKILDKDKYIYYMKKIKPKNYRKTKTLNCDWSDKKKFLIHYRMLKFYVRYGMIV